MNSTDYYVTYNVTNESDLDMVTMSKNSKYPLGGNSFVTRVTIIEGYTTADKETFERIISISENGAKIEVCEWTPADCPMYVKVNS